MKIICVGRNYAEHIEELNNERPDAPVIFMKPETAVPRPVEDFYYPDFSENIEEKFAHTYYEEIGIGIDFTARDLQTKLKGKGLPWELAKAFNGSAPVSEFVPKTQFADVQNIEFSLDVNGETRQQGNTNMMLYKIDYLIAFVSQYFLLKKGDLLFTGTPKGVAAVKIGDTLKLSIEGKEMLQVNVK